MVLIIFGSTGDLARRMLFPSLYHLYKNGRLPVSFKIIAFGRRDFVNTQYTDFLLGEFKDSYGQAFEAESWNRFSQLIEYFKGDLTNEADFFRLGDRITTLDESSENCLKKVFYLATSSDYYQTTFEGINKIFQQVKCGHSEHVSVVIEKPFGASLQSFKDLNSKLLELFSEKQVFRIDHYLGKETVKNILYFRAANPLFLNDWNKNTLDKIEVRAFESLGVEQRASYYDQYGQARDFLQSHMLQLLTLTLMDLPLELTTENIHQAKMKVLNNLQIDNIATDVIRGQYTQGVVEGKSVKGYREELPELAQSNTETYVKIKAKLSDPNWEGVDLFLETGKRMFRKDTSITLYFKSQERVHGITSRNKLVFQLQPREAIALDLQVKKPAVNELDVVPMIFRYQENFKGLLPDAYESLLLNIFEGNKSSFLSTEELEASWRFVDPVTKYWAQQGSEGLVLYPAGSKDV